MPSSGGKIQHSIPKLLTYAAPAVPIAAKRSAARADLMVAFSLNDFPEEVLATCGIEAQYPDEFIGYLLAAHSTRDATLDDLPQYRESLAYRRDMYLFNMLKK